MIPLVDRADRRSSTSASTWSSSSSSSSPAASTRPGPGCSSRSPSRRCSCSPAAVSMALSVLYVRFRDVAIIWIVLAQVLFYATPILYPVDEAGRHRRFEHLLMINPLAVIFEQVRVWILAEPRRADRRRGGRRRGSHLLPALAIFVARLRLRRLDLQPRGAADRRGPLAQLRDRPEPAACASIRSCQGRRRRRAESAAASSSPRRAFGRHRVFARANRRRVKVAGGPAQLRSSSGRR